MCVYIYIYTHSSLSFDNKVFKNLHYSQINKRPFGVLSRRDPLTVINF